MKNLLLLICLISFITIEAGTGGIAGGSDDRRTPNINDEWQLIRKKIKKNTKFKIEGGTIFMGRGRISLFDVCLDGENLKSLSKYNIYGYKRINRDRNERIILDKKILKYPLNYESTKEVCRRSNGRDCFKEDIIVKRDIVKTLKVSKKIRTYGRDKDRDVYKEFFKKRYEIPLCH